MSVSQTAVSCAQLVCDTLAVASLSRYGAHAARQLRRVFVWLCTFQQADMTPPLPSVHGTHSIPSSPGVVRIHKSAFQLILVFL